MKTMIVLLWCFAMVAIAANDTTHEASVDLPRQGLSELAQGNIAIFAENSQFSIIALEQLEQFVIVTLTAHTSIASVVIKIPAIALNGVSLFVGQTVNVITTASGYLLKADSQAIAFLPSNLGRTLIYSERL
jgi:hypothetical protein